MLVQGPGLVQVVYAEVWLVPGALAPVMTRAAMPFMHTRAYRIYLSRFTASSSGPVYLRSRLTDGMGFCAFYFHFLTHSKACRSHPVR